MIRYGIELENARGGLAESGFIVKSEGIMVGEEGGGKMGELERHPGDCAALSGKFFWAPG